MIWQYCLQGFQPYCWLFSIIACNIAGNYISNIADYSAILLAILNQILPPPRATLDLHRDPVPPPWGRWHCCGDPVRAYVDFSRALFGTKNGVFRQSKHWSQLSYGVFCFYYRCVRPPSEYSKPTTFTSLNLFVHYSICEPAQIWICAVSVYNICYQSQSLCLPLNIFLAVRNTNIWKLKYFDAQQI